jgi:hypothetical protein
MFALTSSLFRLLLSPRHVQGIALENLALRQQLAVMKRQCPRPRLRRADRLFWVWLSRIWPHCREALLVVRPETVVGWHRQGCRLFWTWISRRKRSGRPTLPPYPSGISGHPTPCSGHRRQAPPHKRQEGLLSQRAATLPLAESDRACCRASSAILSKIALAAR